MMEKITQKWSTGLLDFLKLSRKRVMNWQSFKINLKSINSISKSMNIVKED